MSGGSGLWFVLCIPTQSYERELQGNSDSLASSESSQTTVVKADTTGDNVSVSLEQMLRKTLEELRIYDALWLLDDTKNYYKVTFPCSPGLRCDIVLTTLTTSGIGMCKGSTLGILPCSVLLQDDDAFREEADTAKLLADDKKSESGSSTTLSKTKMDIKKAFRGFKDMQKKFLQTVTARLTVAQVVEGVRSGAEPTFDFIVFVVVASMISALGLLENSSVAIVASMLISPIMGPILAATFGAVIHDGSLRNMGIKAEILGLSLCVLFGFVFGLLAGCVNNFWGNQQWPTEEMASRGRDRSLWIGVLIALPSGVGVALSVLGGNAGSLVGVAISASLLPPAVNAGLLWGLSAVLKIRSQDENAELYYRKEEGQIRASLWMKPSLMPKEHYVYTYFEEMDKEYAMLGLVSLGLTLLNILCIFIAAVIVLKIKEVAPKTSLSKTSRFWREDIKIARDYNATMPPAKPEEMGNQFLAEWANLNGLETDEVMSDDEYATITRIETLKDIMEDVEADEVFQAISQSVVNKRDSRPLSRRVSTVQAIIHPPPGTGRDPTSVVTSVPAESPIEGVRLRRQEQAPSSRDSVAILRQSLLNSRNTFTLWPSANPGVRRVSRFTVQPIPEGLLYEGPNVGPRISRFLQYPEVVVKETPC